MSRGLRHCARLHATLTLEHPAAGYGPQNWPWRDISDWNSAMCMHTGRVRTDLRRPMVSGRMAYGHGRMGLSGVQKQCRVLSTVSITRLPMLIVGIKGHVCDDDNRP
eukprot:5715916-Prymnesium_polylepis.1